MKPRYFTLMAGRGDADDELNAADTAMWDAGARPYNLVWVTSQLPPFCEPRLHIDLPSGALLPAAFRIVTSRTPGESIAGAVAVGAGSPEEGGMITEWAGPGTQQQALERVLYMLDQGLRQRGVRPLHVLTTSVEHLVRQVGGIFVGVALWSPEP